MKLSRRRIREEVLRCAIEPLEPKLMLAVFAVTTTADSGAGSLRQAILDSNAASGADVIQFNIGTGVQTIAPLSQLPQVTDPLTIDGTTQPGFSGSPIIELNGANAGSSAVGLYINRGGSVIRGLVINRFSGGEIVLNQPQSPSGTIGNQNRIEGNYIGTDISGAIARPGAATAGVDAPGILIAGSSRNIIGGTTPAQRNVISGNLSDGIEIDSSSGNQIMGNSIGTDVTGTNALGNGGYGIALDGGDPLFPDYQNTIGAAASPNVISGNQAGGILAGDWRYGLIVSGNRIGTDATGTLNLGNGGSGVWLSGIGLGVIGGTVTGDGNTIAFNHGSGVLLTDSSAGDVILGNSIFGNNTLGIDLGGDGVTANDQFDLDLGPNNLQNVPTITRVSGDSSATSVSGTLSTESNLTYRIEFFWNTQADSSGAGEGEHYLGFTSIFTDGSGQATFNVSLPPVPAGSWITATATSNYSNSSEFSLAVPIQPVASVSGGVLTLVDHGGDNGLEVAPVNIGGVDYVRLTESLDSSGIFAGSGITSLSSSSVLAPLAGLNSIVLNLLGGNDQLSIQLGKLPASLLVDTGEGHDSLTLHDTLNDDAISLTGNSIISGPTTITLTGVEDLTADLSAAGNDSLTLAQGFVGASGNLIVHGGGAGTDVMNVRADSGPAEQVDVHDGAVTVTQTPTNQLSIRPGESIGSATGMVSSADGQNEYVTTGSSIEFYSRNSGTGGLALVEEYDSLADFYPVRDANGSTSIALSPDGNQVYIAASQFFGTSSTLVTFLRDPQTGRLTDAGVLTEGVNGVDGISGGKAIRVSPDGKNVYVAGTADNAIAVFARSALTGQLTFVEAIKDGQLQGAHVVDGLAGAADLVISPDGQTVYVAGTGDNAVAVFRRDPATGKLSWIETQKDGSSGVSGLIGVASLAMSADGGRLFATSAQSLVLGADGKTIFTNSTAPVVVFFRDPLTGQLSFEQKRTDQVQVTGSKLGISADGLVLYAAGSVSPAVPSKVYNIQSLPISISAQFSAIDQLHITTGSADDIFSIKPDPFVAIVVDGASQGTGDSLGVNKGSAAATDNGTVISVAGLADVIYTGIESKQLTIGTPDFSPPTVSIGAVAPEIRNSPLTQISITFNKAVMGFDLSDLVLERNGAPLSLAGASLSSADGIHWTLTGISALTSAPGAYVVKVNPTGSGVADLAHNPLSTGAFNFWIVDSAPPSLQMPNFGFRKDALDQITISFSEPITGFDLGDLRLTLNNGPNLLTSQQTLVRGPYDTWILKGLGGITNLEGTYRLTLAGSAAGIQDIAGNSLSSDSFITWTLDHTPPVPQIVEPNPDPTDSLVQQITIHFNEPVTGLTLDDLVLTRDGVTIPLQGRASLSTTDNQTWILSGMGISGTLGYVGGQHSSSFDPLALDDYDATAISPDGHWLLVASHDDDSVGLFARDPITGALSNRQFIQSTAPVGTVLDGARGLTWSADGRFAYVVSDTDRSVTVFAQDPQSGLLTPIQLLKDGIAGVRINVAPNRITITPDGTSAYVAATSSLSVFTRDPLTGLLSFVQKLDDSAPSQLTTVFSADGQWAYMGITAGMHQALGVFHRDSSTGALSLVQLLRDGMGGVDGLDGVRGLAISPNGQWLYAAAQTDNSVAVFQRDVNAGTLSFVQVVKNGDTGVIGLTGATAVVASTDGKWVFVAASVDGAVDLFQVDSSTGKLSFVQALKDGLAGVDGLSGASALALSPDGLRIYVAASNENALTVLARDPQTGLLTVSQILRDSTTGITSLAGAGSVVTSSDGAWVYVGAFFDAAISVFHADPVTRALSLVQTVGLSVAPFKLQTPSALAMSPDGKSLFEVASQGSSIGVFSRDPATGFLSLVQTVSEGNGVQGLSGAITVSLSPDGKQVYAAGSYLDGVAIFQRDSLTGQIAFSSNTQPPTGLNDGLGNTLTMAVSSDSQWLYVASSGDNSITLFRRQAGGILVPLFSVIQGQGGISSLTFASAIVLSSDGKWLYVAGENDNAVSLFQRDLATGALTVVQTWKEHLDGVQGLLSVSDIKLSPDGNWLYTAGSNEDTLGVFHRDNTTGLLTYAGALTDKVGAVIGLDGINSITISGDGSSIYTTSSVNRALGVFHVASLAAIPTFVSALLPIPELGAGSLVASPDGQDIYTIAASTLVTLRRDPTTGLTNPIQVLQNNTGGADGLDPVSFTRISPNGRWLLAAQTVSSSSVQDRITVFQRDPATGAMVWIRTLYQNAGGIDALDQLSDIAFSPDGSFLYITARAVNAIAVYHFDDSSGNVQFVQMLVDGIGGVDGLRNATATIVSPDGHWVYAVSNSDNSIAVFQRDMSTGALTQVQVLIDGMGGVDGLASASALACSADGSSVYVTGTLKSAVAVFHRNANGLLTYVQVLKDGIGGVDGLSGVRAVAVSPDGNWVYATGTSESALGVFQRDPATGLLSFKQVLKDGVGGIDGLANVSAVGVSPDSQFVYTVSQGDSAVLMLRRDPLTGLLSTAVLLKQGVNGVAGLNFAQSLTLSPDGKWLYTAPTNDRGVTAVFIQQQSPSLAVNAQFKNGYEAQSLFGANSVAISPDGTNVYVTASFAFSVFRRDPATGLLTQIQTLQDNVQGVDGLGGAAGVTVSKDGKWVYVIAKSDNSLAVFARNPLNGTLTFVQVLKDNISGVDGLASPTAVAASPNGPWIFVTSSGDNSLAVFRQDPISGQITFAQLLKQGAAGIDGLTGAASLTVSGDGGYVYTVSSSNALAVFRQDQASGAVSQVQVLKDNTAGIDGLANPLSVAVSPDGSKLYVAAAVDGSVAVFSRNPATGMLTQAQVLKSTTSGIGDLAGASAIALSPDGQYIYAGSVTKHALSVLADLQSPGGYTLAVNPSRGDVVDLSGNPLAVAASGSWTVTIAGLTASPGATYTLTGPANAPILNVASGTVMISPLINTIFPILNVSVAGGGVLTLNGSLRLSSLTLASGAVATVQSGNTLTVSGLSFTGSARLDLGTGFLIYNYQSGQGAAAISQIAALINKGFNNGNWGGAGITSSNAAANSGLAIGFEDNNNGGGGAILPSFGGQTAGANSILARFTLAGDANLDASVGFADLVAVAQHYGQSTATTWSGGDLNYDSAVGFADLVAVAQKYGQTLPSGAAEAIAPLISTPAAAEVATPSEESPKPQSKPASSVPVSVPNSPKTVSANPASIAATVKPELKPAVSSRPEPINRPPTFSKTPITSKQVKGRKPLKTPTVQTPFALVAASPFSNTGRKMKNDLLV